MYESSAGVRIGSTFWAISFLFCSVLKVSTTFIVFGATISRLLVPSSAIMLWNRYYLAPSAAVITIANVIKISRLITFEDENVSASRLIS